MSEVVGDESLKKAIEASGALISLALSVLKDGAQLADLGLVAQKLIGDPAFLALIEDAIKHANEIPAEVKDLSLAEGADLVKVLYDQVVIIVAAAKK
jgi:hypothetical protein